MGQISGGNARAMVLENDLCTLVIMRDRDRLERLAPGTAADNRTKESHREKEDDRLPMISAASMEVGREIQCIRDRKCSVFR